MKYRFALVGCGKIGPRHAEQMARLGSITAVCDTDRKKARALAGQYNTLAYNSLDELLLRENNNIDVISICTPNYLHAPHTIQSLRNGLNVLCEKPMSITVEEGNNMLAVAEASNRRLFIVKQNRLNPPVKLVKKLLDEGKLGKVHAFQVNCFWNRSRSYYIDSPWKGRKAMDGGILLTQFSHFVDLLVWFLGEATCVRAMQSNFLLGDTIEMEDTGFAVLRLKSGATGTFNYTVTSFGKNMEGSITLFGEKGTVKIGGQYLNTLEYFNVEGESVPVLENSKIANDYGFYQGSMSNHDIMYDNVAKALNNTSHSIVEGMEALKCIRMIEQINLAAEQ